MQVGIQSGASRREPAQPGVPSTQDPAPAYCLVPTGTQHPSVRSRGALGPGLAGPAGRAIAGARYGHFSARGVDPGP
jgi:hypothetical protein